MSDPTIYRRHLNQIIAVSLGCALAVVVTAVWTIVNRPATGARPYDIAMAVVVITVAARMMLHLRIGQIRITQSLIDTAIMLGLITLSWPWLVLAVAVGVTAARLQARLPLRRVGLDAAKAVIMAGAAVSAGMLVGLGRPPFYATLPRIPELLVVAGVMLIFDEALEIPARALADEQPARAIFSYNWHVRIGGSIVRLLVAIAAGYFLRFDPRIAIVTPLAIVGLQLAYANHVQQRADRVAWQRLAKIVDVMGSTNGDALRRRTVLAAAELFSCDEVDLEIQLRGRRHLLRGNADTILYSGRPEAAPASRGMVVSAALDMPDGSPTRPDQIRLRFRTSVVFTEREHYTLRALAAALGTALHKASAMSEAARLISDQAHAASHDRLTGLANRQYLLAYGTTAPADARIALVVVYLDRFKQINDALGQAVGDNVLSEIARRLVAAIPANRGDLAARLAGAEFAVMLADAPLDLMSWVRDLIADISAPMVIGSMRLEVGATAGVATGYHDGGIDELLRQAEVAMYQAKDQGEPIARYVRTQDTADTDRLALSADLARAVAERKFTVAFQPIVDLTTGLVVSAEALARWYHPQRGHLSPDRFVEAIERSGLLAPFTSHVLDQALAGAAQWREAGFDFPVAVNVSPRSLLDPSFPESIPRALAAHDLPPQALTIELTETLTLSQLEVVDDVLHGLRTLGVSIALDDFGTGFSSLATITRVPVHELKIDRSFVSGLEGAPQAAIVRSTIELGRSLDLIVVAEGIEHPEQRERLWRLGCSAGQGHLFARPTDVTQFLARLREGHDGVPGRLVAPMHDGGEVIQLPASRRTQATPQPTPRKRPDKADSRTAMPE
jgi:diguanylate cyclase (GGDEF)-like protein